MTAYALSNDPSAAPLREPRSAACGVAVVGAGPYGLAVSAALRGAGGVDVRTFGEPMSFWDGQMPEGMLLRSPREASHIGDPSGEWFARSLRGLDWCRGGPAGPAGPLRRLRPLGAGKRGARPRPPPGRAAAAGAGRLPPRARRRRRRHRAAGRARRRQSRGSPGDRRSSRRCRPSSPPILPSTATCACSAAAR